MPVFCPGCYMFCVWLLSHNKLLTRDTCMRNLACCAVRKRPANLYSLVVMWYNVQVVWKEIVNVLQCSEFVNFESMARVWLSNTNNAALNTITAGMLSTTWKLCIFCLITVVWFRG